MQQNTNKDVSDNTANRRILCETNKTGNVRINVTLRRFLATVITVEKQ